MKNELGLSSFAAKEIVELIAMAADHPIREISVEKQTKTTK